jgi:adenylate cyclase class IV
MKQFEVEEKVAIYKSEILGIKKILEDKFKFECGGIFLLENILLPIEKDEIVNRIRIITFPTMIQRIETTKKWENGQEITESFKENEVYVLTTYKGKYKTKREVFKGKLHGKNVEVCIDEVEGLPKKYGKYFMEVEILVESEAKVPGAKVIIKQVLDYIFKGKKREKVLSYSQMLREEK